MKTKLVLAAAAVSGLMLTACTPESETASVPEPPPTTAAAPTTEVAPEPTETETETEVAPEPTETTTEATAETVEPSIEPTTEAPDDTATTDPTASGELPAPGTELQVGETATLHVQSGEEGDQYYGFALVDTTVTAIEEGDPALFQDAANAADFAGLSPWFVKVSYEWTSMEGNPNANMTPRITAFNSQGGELSPVINSTWSGGIPGCTLELPDERPYPAGAAGTNCHVFAVPDGEVIGYAAWQGDDYADGMGRSSGNQYYDAPVTWAAP